MENSYRQKNTNPLITIGIPTYNRADTLKEALDSIMNQDFDNYEIVIVDDGSTDDTEIIIRNCDSINHDIMSKECQSKDGDDQFRIPNSEFRINPKLRYIKKQNTGIADTRNRIVQEARGEWVLWLDSDDKFEPNVLGAYVQHIRQYPDVSVFYGNLQCFGSRTDMIVAKDYYSPDQSLINDLVTYSGGLPQPGACIKKQVFDEHGGYKYVVEKQGEDRGFWIRICNKVKFKNLNMITIHYRVHDNNISGITEHRNRSMAVQQMLDRYSLPELFPNLDWSMKKSAELLAFLEMGKVFANERDITKSLQYYNKAFDTCGLSSAVSNFDSVLHHINKIAPDITNEHLNVFNSKKLIDTEIKGDKSRTLDRFQQLKSSGDLRIAKDTPRYIVSLTSHGERIRELVHFSVITLLHQTIKPDKVILWLSPNDERRISPILQDLTAYGLEIRFTQDIRSCTKLQDHIITAEDDILYPENWFEQLLTTQLSQINQTQDINIATQEKHNWRNTQTTNYQNIDFTNIEFFEAQTLKDIDEKLAQRLTVTNQRILNPQLCEMSKKEREFLNGIIRKAKPKIVVEIGVSGGGSACVILNALKDVEGAKLYSFDYNTIWHRELNIPNGRKTGYAFEQILPDQKHRWELHTGGVASKFLESCLPKEGIDICLLDSAHINPGEHLNILEILPYMKKNGIVIYHDTTYHTGVINELNSTNRVSINTLNGKRILLKSEQQPALANIEAIILDHIDPDMLYALFTNLTLPWGYNITDDDFCTMLSHFENYYSKDLVQIYYYYSTVYMNGGYRNESIKDLVAQKTNQYITPAFSSSEYWENRYAQGKNSGAGSYGLLAQFKAEVINQFVNENSIMSVIEFGCGDGNQLTLANYPKYLGLDVSDTSINKCRVTFNGDSTKEFRLLNHYNGEKADLVLSLDVIYHLIEDHVFHKYMETLFKASNKFVIIYSSDMVIGNTAEHVKHRKFTNWIKENKNDWNLFKFIKNKFPDHTGMGDIPNTSFCDFYVFVKVNEVKDNQYSFTAKTNTLIQIPKANHPFIKKIIIENTGNEVAKNVIVKINNKSAVIAGWDLYPNEALIYEYDSQQIGIVDHATHLNVKQRVNLSHRINIGINSPYAIQKIENLSKKEIINLPTDKIITNMKFDSNKINLSDDVQVHYQLLYSVTPQLITTENYIEIISHTECSLNAVIITNDTTELLGTVKGHSGEQAQLSDDQYIENFLEYNNQTRFISYSVQLKEILTLKPKSVLEIGVWYKVLGSMLKSFPDIDYKTLDIDENNKLDIVGSVTNIALEDKQFDIVCAFQVLEHLPFDLFETSLTEMMRVANKGVIISLPHIPEHKVWKICQGGHYWGVGCVGYEIDLFNNFLSEIAVQNSFKLVKNYEHKESHKKHFWVFERLTVINEQFPARLNYMDLDFTNISGFEEAHYSSIKEKMLGYHEGTNELKMELSYDEPAFINGIIRKTRPKNVVEIGVSAGGSSCVILNALRDINGAKLYSFDYNTDWHHNKRAHTNFKTGFLVDQIVPDLKHKWTFYAGGVPSLYIEDCLQLESVDICFIDTAHINPVEHLNILEIFPFLKKNAIVIYHDTRASNTNRSSINTLEGKYIKPNDCSNFPLPNIGAVVLSDNTETMKYKLFSNISLAWAYVISEKDFMDMLIFFAKHYPVDWVMIYVWYYFFFLNGGYNNKFKNREIAREETKKYKELVTNLQKKSKQGLNVYEHKESYKKHSWEFERLTTPKEKFVAKLLTEDGVYHESEEKSRAIADAWDGLCPPAADIDYISGSCPIVLCSNERYAPYLAVCIQSILDNTNPKRHYHIIILESDITKDSKNSIISQVKKHPNCKIDFINVKSTLDTIPIRVKQDRPSKDYYNRLLIPYILSYYPKVIYIDLDTIVKADISELLDLDLGNYSIAVTPDLPIWGNLKVHDYENLKLYSAVIATFVNDWTKYFNSGVILFDTKKFKDQISFSHLFKTVIYQSLRFERRLHDQDVLNSIIQSNYLPLPRKWNYICEIPMSKYYSPVPKDTKIIHYASSKKPWCDLDFSHNPDALNYRQYAQSVELYNLRHPRSGDLRIAKDTSRSSDLRIAKAPHTAMHEPQQTIRSKRDALNTINLLKPLVERNTPRYIVSLTSFGKRIKESVHFTIISLMHQTVPPDKIVLWIGYQDAPYITPILKHLTELGLQIEFCEDIKSYTKLIPALGAYPNDYIITADDDILYPSDWLEKLMYEHKNNPNKIICSRAHEIKFNKAGEILPYLEWEHKINENKNVTDYKFVFPTGVGGVLYPPNCLSKDVFRADLFLKLAPHADDIWFWAMAILHNDYHKGINPFVPIQNGFCTDDYTVDPDEQNSENNLWNKNKNGGNDKQLQNLLSHYPQIMDYLHMMKNEKHFISADDKENKTPSNTTIIQELEILEKFLTDSTEYQIWESATYIANRAYLNIGKINSTPDSHLKPRFINIADKVSKYLTG